MRIDILGQERRRRWSDEKKLEIILSVGADGAGVTEVARLHDVTRQQIYKWRRELKMKGLLAPSPNALFLPVEMPVVQNTSHRRKDTNCLPPMIELQLCCGRSLRFDSGMDTVVLTRLIRAVEAA